MDTGRDGRRMGWIQNGVITGRGSYRTGWLEGAVDTGRSGYRTGWVQIYTCSATSVTGRGG